MAYQTEAKYRGHTSSFGRTFRIADATARDQDFSNLKARSFSVENCLFENCRFERIKIEEACFGAGRRASVYKGCIFDGSRIRASAPGIARFERCSFKNVVLEGFFCMSVEILDCKFSGKIKKSVFNGAVPSADISWLGRSINEFAGNDFSEVELIDVAFRTGVDLAKQKLPEGPDYFYIPNADRRVRDVKEELSSWPDGAEKRGSLLFIQMLELELCDGQSGLLLRPKDFARSRRSTIERVCLMLKA